MVAGQHLYITSGVQIVFELDVVRIHLTFSGAGISKSFCQANALKDPLLIWLTPKEPAVQTALSDQKCLLDTVGRTNIRESTSSPLTGPLVKGRGAESLAACGRGVAVPEAFACEQADDVHLIKQRASLSRRMLEQVEVYGWACEGCAAVPGLISDQPVLALTS